MTPAEIADRYVAEWQSHPVTPFRRPDARVVQLRQLVDLVKGVVC